MSETWPSVLIGANTDFWYAVPDKENLIFISHAMKCACILGITKRIRRSYAMIPVTACSFIWLISSWLLALSADVRAVACALNVIHLLLNRSQLLLIIKKITQAVTQVMCDEFRRLITDNRQNNNYIFISSGRLTNTLSVKSESLQCCAR